MNKQTQNKHTHTKTYRFRSNRISVLVVLMLLLHHPALVLVFKQRICLNLTSFSSFRSSCLVSSSLSEVWQFKFAFCPQVLEINSVAHQLPCFGVGFSLCWFTEGLFLCLAPFLWDKLSDPSASPLLSACCDGLLIIFQLYSVIWLWMLLTGSGDELCGLLPALFQAVAYHWPAVCPSVFPAFVYRKFEQRSAPCLSPLL
jgi:hypothetical protein